MVRKKSFLEKYLGGHFKIVRITVYGRNAMHWGVTIKTKRGYLCFRLPFTCFGKWWSLYLYHSPDGTPCHKSAYFYVGNEMTA